MFTLLNLISILRFHILYVIIHIPLLIITHFQNKNHKILKTSRCVSFECVFLIRCMINPTKELTFSLTLRDWLINVNILGLPYRYITNKLCETFTPSVRATIVSLHSATYAMKTIPRGGSTLKSNINSKRHLKSKHLVEYGEFWRITVEDNTQLLAVNTAHTWQHFTAWKWQINK